MNYQESREYIDRVTREIPSVLGLDHKKPYFDDSNCVEIRLLFIVEKTVTMAKTIFL